jgi:hypothetical protein
MERHVLFQVNLFALYESPFGLVVRAALEGDRVDGAFINDRVLECQPNHFQVCQNIAMRMLWASIDDDREFFGVFVPVVVLMPMVPMGVTVGMLGLGGHKNGP